ncbi:MAG TPA: hypothetical protein P5077_09625 [bacterium]|nr:hypothetical protein [bacterium]
MAALLSIIAIIVLAGALLLAGDKNPGTNTKVKKPTTTCTGKEVTLKHIKSLHRCAVETALASLENGDSQENVKRKVDLAMCYAILFYDNVAEYPCPECGEKTIFDKDWITFIRKELPLMRELVAEIAQISGLSIKLEEHQLCKSCSPENSPMLINLVVTYSDGTLQITELDKASGLKSLKAVFKAIFPKLFSEKIELSQEDIDTARSLLGIKSVPDKK